MPNSKSNEGLSVIDCSEAFRHRATMTEKILKQRIDSSIRARYMTYISKLVMHMQKDDG